MLSLSKSLSRLLPALLLLSLAGCASAPPPVKNAETMFKEGEDFYTSKRYEDAIAQWKRVREAYTSPELSTLAELKIADAHYDNEAFIEATAAYEEFRKLHPAHEKAAYALYRQGLGHYRQISGIDTDQTPVNNAVITFDKFLALYPQSEYAKDVQEKLEICRIKQAEYGIYIGRFYFRTEKYEAAIGRLEEVLRNFPKSSVNDEALFILGKAHFLAGNKTKGRDAFNRLFNEYRLSRFVEEAKKFLDKHY